MIPEFGDGVLGIAVLETGVADSLEDFGNVSQVESVMGLFGSGQQVCFDGFVDFDDGLNEDFLDILDFVVESLHEVSHDLGENVGNGLVVKFSVRNHVEMPYESWRNLSSSSTGWTEGCQNDDVLYFHELLILPVVPSFMIQELSQQLNWRLCSVLFFFGHVQIIHKNNILFANRCPENTSFNFFQFEVNRILGLVGRSLCRENN
jgi:hypothetical protein